MDLKTQIIQEYLMQGGDFRKLAEKYGISRTTICRWVLIHQEIMEKYFKIFTAF